MSKTTIFTYNVNGISGKDKRIAIFQWLKTQKVDISLLQEVHFKQADKEKWEKEWDGTIINSGNSSNQLGVSILFRNGLNIQILNTFEIEIGRVLAVHVRIENKEVFIINVYGPNKDDIDIFCKLEAFVKDRSDHLFIIGGDFNVVLEPNIDKQGGNPHTHLKCRKKIKSILETFQLNDIFRVQNPFTKRFTWRSKVRLNIACRLDYFVASNDLVNIVEKSGIKPSFKSDHSKAYVTLNFDPIVR